MRKLHDVLQCAILDLRHACFIFGPWLNFRYGSSLLASFVESRKVRAGSLSWSGSRDQIVGKDQRSGSSNGTAARRPSVIRVVDI